MPTRPTSNTVALPVPENRGTLEALRRKLGFRAWHRGTREADLLLGTFADECLSEFAAEELHQFERLLEEDDPIIEDWITGRLFVPSDDFALWPWTVLCLATADERRLAVSRLVVRARSRQRRIWSDWLDRTKHAGES